MSGGIDSTVSAMLLQEQGYEVVGCTFRTYDSIRESCLKNEKGCCDMESMLEAKANCKRLGIEHHLVDFREQFREHVISDFVNEYCHGRTPNPCVLCNAYIKFGAMLRLADEWGCDYVATGHYARLQNGYLRVAADKKKDQTYFLWMLRQEQLSRILFPLGDRTKDEVRTIAKERGFERLVQKHESQDICFVSDGDYRTFLAAENVTSMPGEIVADGKSLTEHKGVHNFTIGQRKGLGVATGYPAFVTTIDPESGMVTLGHREDLNRTDISLNKAWLSLPEDATEPLRAKVRYRSESVPCRVEYDPTSATVQVHFLSPVWAPTPGQSCVFYQGDLLVGGGIIQTH